MKNTTTTGTLTGTPTDALEEAKEESKTSTVDTGTQEEEKVSVTREFLKDIQKTILKQQKDIGFLKSVADKKSVALYHQRNKGEIPTTMRIRTMDVRDEKDVVTTKVIIGWKTLEDDVWQDGNRWKERQIVELLYQDETSQKMSLVEFNRRFKHVICTKAGTITDDKTGALFFKLVRQDTGEEIIISATFIN